MARIITVECKIVYHVYAEDEPQAVGLAALNLQSDIDQMVQGESMTELFEFKTL